MRNICKSPLMNYRPYMDVESAIDESALPATLTGLTDGAKAHLSCGLSESTRRRLLVTYDEMKARQLYQDIIGYHTNVYLYPALDLLFFSADVRGRKVSQERIDIWHHIIEDDEIYIVTTADALMDKLEARDTLVSNILKIKSIDTINLVDIGERLVALGYERTPQVDVKGTFDIRGGILDIYPVTSQLPVRIELWGDDIDSMRMFDPDSQRSVETIDEVTIYPADEGRGVGEASFLSYFYDGLIFVDEPTRIYEKMKDTQDEYIQAVTGRSETVGLDELPELFSAETLVEMIVQMRSIYFCTLSLSIKPFDSRSSFDFHTGANATYKNAYDLMIEDLQRLVAADYSVVLMTSSRTRIDRLSENLREHGLKAYAIYEADEELEPRSGAISVIYGNSIRGFEYPELKFALLTENDIFGNTQKKKRKKKFAKKEGALGSLDELTFGDFVVHEDHGLGVYRGIEQIDRDGVLKDYIKLEYRDGAFCYLPATRLDLIQKYAASDAPTPRLNRLGTYEWTNAKKKVKQAVEVIARQLVELYAARLKGTGYAYGPDSVWQKEFEETFPYEETSDQIRAIEETKDDMEHGRIMDRLICGDVGYGKTEIALRAAFKAVQEGKQVIYLVPTTLLAQQHYNTFASRLKNFPVRVDLMCRFRTPRQMRQSLDDFRKGLVDILVGTHRVLSKDIEPHDLGLLVIDEEQRFGVKHKEKLKRLKKDVDVLTLTATPIPRTLHMSLSGIRDMSVLREPPKERVPVQTYVCEYNDEIVREAIRREVSRGGQVYYVYNRVRSIVDVEARIKQLVPDAVVAYAHGKMDEDELEDIMIDFVNGDIDVLVSTTIIETGLDIPNANTMIIQDADKMGLSQLYQLRGRVGRSSRAAYCFLLYRRDKMLSEEADKRLKAIKEFTELGSGIKIAMRDLEIRGAGNVLGSEQHGHMAAVGYDLYCKLLNEAIKKQKGEIGEDTEYDTSVDISADAYIPASYIPDEEHRLSMYKKIATIKSEDDYMDMADELMDRYGDMPQSVTTLLLVARLRAVAHEAYVTDIAITARMATLTMYKNARLDATKFASIVGEYHGRLIVKNGETMKLELHDETKSPRHSVIEASTRGSATKMLDEVMRLCEKIAGARV